jgi:hypothetical protein
MNLIAALGAYCFFDKKPAIQFDMKKPDGQPDLLQKKFLRKERWVAVFVVLLRPCAGSIFFAITKTGKILRISKRWINNFILALCLLWKTIKLRI